MMILATNDDGVRSEGLRRLVRSLERLGEVYVVAPDREQSAASHSLTLHRPLRVEEVAPRFFAVDGTPTDCVNLAICGILPRRPDLVVSGINCGANLGDDITYSGTVSAAIEATLLGVKAIAASLAASPPYDFAAAAEFVGELAAYVLRTGLPPGTLLNVNIPAGDRTQLREFRLTKMGKRRYDDAVVEKIDPRGRKYYWIGGEELAFESEPGTDFAAISEGAISITPVHLDLTNYAALEQLKGLRLAWP